jgi:hypothetical protein
MSKTRKGMYLNKKRQSLSNLRRREQRELERQEKKGLNSQNEIQKNS